MPLVTLTIFVWLAFVLAPFASFAQDGYVPGSPAIAFWKHGSQSVKVIVIHGGPGAAHNYLLPEWNKLAEAATIYYYDQRGTGRSEKSNCYSWIEHVNDLNRLIATVAQGEKIVLAGSSWGSTLALLYAYRFPEQVKALILSGTYHWIGTGAPPKDCDHYLLPILKQLPDTTAYRMLSLTDTSGRPVITDKRMEINRIGYSMTVQSLSSAPALTSLSVITIPALVFKGNGDCGPASIKEGADLYLSVLPKGEAYLVEGGCHDPWITHTAAFFSKCIDFIRKL